MADIEEDLDDEELEVEPKPEPLQVPDDPNEPIEVKTDEAVRESRKARRAERQNEFRRNQEEAARLRVENEQLRRQPTPQPQHQQQQLHPSAQKLRDLDAIEDRLHKEYAIVAGAAGYDQNGTQEAEYRRQARAIQVARIAAVNEAQAPRVDEAEMMRKFAWQQFTSEHSDVFTDQKAQAWALGRWQQLVQGEGKADTRQLAEEILDQARVRFGMKPRRSQGSTPTPADRQRYTGVGSRAGQGSDTGSIAMSKDDKRMARIAFMGTKVNGKERTEAEAYQHWANTVGKKRQEQKSKGG